MFEWPAVIVIYIKNPCIGVDAGIVADGGVGGLLNGFKKRFVANHVYCALAVNTTLGKLVTVTLYATPPRAKFLVESCLSLWLWMAIFI